MTWQLVFQLGAFASGQMSDHAQMDAAERLMDALVHVNRLWLPFHPRTPPLYTSGVVFVAEEPFTPNEGHDIPSTLARGYGHCIALACWRLAEILERREDPRAKLQILRWPTGAIAPGLESLHIAIRRGNGTIEDPAKRLGMP